MQSQDDTVLLRQYVNNHSEEAFRAIVARHLNLVYSVAVRCVRDPNLAEEIAQDVFIILARKAAELRHEKALSSWLFQTTRLTARNSVRSHTRRQQREHHAYMQSKISESGSDLWPRVAPLLDEAVAALSEKDRHSIVLRYYEGRSLREVGVALDASEDAVEKRVHRALEKLRTFFARRGVTVGASGLIAIISANAVQAAPAGLALTISSAATLAETTAITTVIKTVAMTALQKTVITCCLAAAVGTALYQARQASNAQSEIQALRRQAPDQRLQQLQNERDDATNRMAALLAENEQLKSNNNSGELLKLRGTVARLQNEANDPSDVGAKALAAKVARLKQRLAETPNAKIPELQLLTERDWLNAANDRLDTEIDYRRALGALRTAAETKFATTLKSAVNQFKEANSGQFPTDLSQLQPFFTGPVDDAMLQRWAVVPASTIKSLGMGGNSIITQKDAVDDVFDVRFGIGPNGTGTTDFLWNHIQTTMDPIYKAFQKEHNGKWPADLAEYLPYATTPDQQIAIRKLMEQKAGNQTD